MLTELINKIKFSRNYNNLDTRIWIQLLLLKKKFKN